MKRKNTVLARHFNIHYTVLWDRFGKATPISPQVCRIKKIFFSLFKSQFKIYFPSKHCSALCVQFQANKEIFLV